MTEPKIEELERKVELSIQALAKISEVVSEAYCIDPKTSKAIRLVLERLSVELDSINNK